MLDNLMVVAVIIIILWLGALTYYLYVSRQQNELGQEIDKLRKQLDSIEREA
jgi:hypothetical protein